MTVSFPSRNGKRLVEAAARLLASDVGVSAVEFALLAPAFIALVLVTLMAGVIFMAQSELDAATVVVARAIMTGQATTSSQVSSDLCGAIGGMFTCSNMMINLNSYSTLASLNTTTPTLTYGANGAVTNTWGTNFGAQGSLMVLQVMYQYPVIGGWLFSFATQPNGSYLTASTSVFINEW